MSQRKRTAADGLYLREGMWWIRTDPITGDRKSTGCRDREAARAVKRERERCAADPAYAASKTARLGLYVGKLHEAKAKKKPGTRDMYRTKVGHVVRVLGESMSLAVAGDPATFAMYIARRREEGAGDNTIGKELLALEAILQIAQREGTWTGDPTALRPVGFVSGYVPRKRALMRSEYTKLRDALPAARRKHLAVAVATGARRSELPNTTIAGDIVQILGTKTTGSARAFALVAEWQRALLSTPFEGPTVFGLGPWGGMNSDLVRASRKAELGWTVTPNDLRRTFASWLIEAGVTRQEVAAMLGHTGVGMVFKVYGRADAAEEGAQIRRRLGESAGATPSYSGDSQIRDRSSAGLPCQMHPRQVPACDLNAGDALCNPDMHRTYSSQLQACDPNPLAQVSVFFG